MLILLKKHYISNINIIKETFSRKDGNNMLITNNHKIILFTCSEIKNIFESIYGLNYSKSFISKTFIEIDACIRVGIPDYIAEEFIQYLFFKKSQDLPSIKIKIAKRKEEILHDIDPELLELGLLAQKAKNKKGFLSNKERRAKRIERKLIEIEILERIRKKKCLFCKYDKIFKKFDSASNDADISRIEDLIDNLLNIM
ncbi:hypothetical protein [Borrelia sp. P9F1]|uniref:hypothetical protein n=1 Tax=Borrelia sp. P9F1 TaxID=3058374 RepID=UPI00264860E9|nr:hypothetical protein [Borrelia sp. P9F1]WKC58621.1 hypothetical protein QYZ68_05315 [Borrelia sp. P9F1]